jgi:hypothetical protein
MKTKSLLSFLVIFCFSISIYANSRETITLTNIEKTEKGCIKEFLQCEKETNMPLTKTVYIYDQNEKLIEKSGYEWDGKKGWTGTLKYMYSYDKENKPLTPTVIKWDKKNNNWLEK